MIYGTGKKLLDCEYVKEPDAAVDFTNEFWQEEHGKNHTVKALSGKYASLVDFQNLKNACHKNHKKTRRRLAYAHQRHHENTVVVSDK